MEEQLDSLLKDIREFDRQNYFLPKAVKVSCDFYFNLMRTLRQEVVIWSDGKKTVFGIPIEIDPENDAADYVLMKTAKSRIEIKINQYDTNWEYTSIFQTIEATAFEANVLAQQIANQYKKVVRWNYEGSLQGHYTMPDNI